MSLGFKDLGNGVTEETVNLRTELCRRKDYIEHLQLRMLRPVDSSDSESGSGSESDSESEDEDEYEQYPITHEFEISTSNKRVTSLCTNKSSSEFVVGSVNSSLNFYNYNQLQLNKTVPYTTKYPFTEEVVISEFGTTKESGNYSIEKLVNDVKTDNYLVIPNHSIFKVLSSKGEEKWSSTKGDRYIQDYALTKGHLDEIKDGIIDSDEVFTCSKDSTIRKWNLVKQLQDSVTVYNDLKRKRISIDRIAKCGNSNRNLISANSEGLLSLYDLKNLHAPIAKISDSPLVSLNVNKFNQNQIITRTEDHCIKVFDLRNFSAPVMTRSQFAHSNKYQNLQISSNGMFILGSTLSQDKHELHLIEISDLSTKFKLSLDHEPTCLHWDYTINQILIGGNSGSVISLFNANENVSQKGIKLLLNKPASKRPLENESHPTNIYNSEELSNNFQNKKSKQQLNYPVRQQDTNKDITVFTKKDLHYIKNNIEHEGDNSRMR